MTASPTRPQDLLSERLVLAPMMMSRAAFEQARERLTAAHFHTDAHRAIFTAGMEVGRGDVPLNPYTVGKMLMEDERLSQVVGPRVIIAAVDELQELVNGDVSPALVRFEIDKVVDAFEERQLRNLLRAADARLGNGTRTADVCEELRRDLDVIAAPITGGRLSDPLSTLLSEADDPIVFLVDRLVVAGANGWIGGEPKSLKSWLALYLALCIALKIPPFGRYHVPAAARVLYIQEEDNRRRVRRRIRKILRGFGVDAPSDAFFRYSIKRGLLLDEQAWVEALRRELAEYKPDVVVGDVFENMHGKDSMERAELKPVFYTLNRLQEEFRCGFLLVDHFKKAALGSSKRGGQRLAGSVGKHAWGESSIYLFPAPGQNQVRVETELKDASSEAFTLTLTDTEDDGVRFDWTAEDDAKAAEMKAKVLDAVASVGGPGEWVTGKAVAEAAGISPNTATKWLNLLVDEDQKLERDRIQVGKVKPWHWRLRASC